MRRPASRRASCCRSSRNRPSPRTSRTIRRAPGRRVKLPATIQGSIGRAGDVDYYRFEAKAGQEIGVQIQPADKAKLDVVLQLIDAEGRILTESTNGLLGYTCPKAGVYALGIRDREYRGDPGMKYQLTIGDCRSSPAFSRWACNAARRRRFVWKASTSAARRSVRSRRRRMPLSARACPCLLAQGRSRQSQRARR